MQCITFVQVVKRGRIEAADSFDRFDDSDS